MVLLIHFLGVKVREGRSAKGFAQNLSFWYKPFPSAR